jgi:hypothetical protein
MATEYRQVKNFTPNKEFFENQMFLSNQIWFVFCNSNNEVIGSTKLGLCNNGSVVIDETQLHPKSGQGRNIIQNYFKRFIPLLDKSGFNYWTEFVLSIGSRSLRKTLLADLNMYVTGIRPSSYINPVNNTPVSCLIAHAPSDIVTKKIHELSQLDSPTKILTFLEIILGKETKRFSKKYHRTATHNEEVIVSIENTKKLKQLIEIGYEPVAVNPFDSLVHFDVPNLELSTQLWYLERESNANVTRIARYILNKNMPLKKSANKPI